MNYLVDLLNLIHTPKNENEIYKFLFGFLPLVDTDINDPSILPVIRNWHTLNLEIKPNYTYKILHNSCGYEIIQNRNNSSIRVFLYNFNLKMYGENFVDSNGKLRYNIHHDLGNGRKNYNFYEAGYNSSYMIDNDVIVFSISLYYKFTGVYSLKKTNYGFVIQEELKSMNTTENKCIARDIIIMNNQDVNFIKNCINHIIMQE